MSAYEAERCIGADISMSLWLSLGRDDPTAGSEWYALPNRKVGHHPVSMYRDLLLLCQTGLDRRRIL